MPEPLRFPSAGIALDRRRRRFLAAQIALVGSIVLALLVPAGWITPLLLLVAAGSGARLLGMRFEALISAPPQARRWGEVRFAEDGGMTLSVAEVEHRYPPGATAEGWVEDFVDAVSVVLRLRNGDMVTIGAEDAAQAAQILAAAGVSAEQRTLRLRLANDATQVPLGGVMSVLGSLVFAGVAGAVLIGVVLSGGASFDAVSAAWLVAALGALALVARGMVPAQVVIGADGISVERVFSRRFIPFGVVVGVGIDAGAVVLSLRGEPSPEPLRLPTGARYFAQPSYEQAALQAMLVDRIEEARRAGKAGSSAGLDVAALGRRGRPFAAWREAVRRLGAGEAEYRRPPVPPEALARVLEDAGAPAERRIGAALALGAAGEGRRIERAVAACADTRLRIALESAATDRLAEEEMAAVLEAERKAGS
jgi:hypothetical protein